MKRYSLTIIVFTALLIALTALNVPFFLAMLYWLPMSIAIAAGADSFESFYVIFVPICLGLASLMFLPLLVERRFKSRMQQVSVQIGLLMLYLMITLVTFYTTGSWTSV